MYSVLENIRKISYIRFLIILCHSGPNAYGFKVIFGLERISISSRIMKVNALEICSGPFSFRTFSRCVFTKFFKHELCVLNRRNTFLELFTHLRFSTISPGGTGRKWERERVKEKRKRSSPLITSRPFLARFSISQPTRELCDYVRSISVPSRNILHSTIESRRFALSAVLNDRCSPGNLVIINSTGNYHDMLLASYASYICNVCRSAQISSNEIRKSATELYYLNCTTVAQYSNSKDNLYVKISLKWYHARR